MALWIATSDRRLRKKDRDDADFTQAKLVIVWTVRRTEQPPWLQVMVRNKGSRPILDVTFVRLSVEDHDFLLPAPADNPLPVVDPNGDGNFIFYASDDLDDAFRRALLGFRTRPACPLPVRTNSKTSRQSWNQRSSRQRFNSPMPTAIDGRKLPPIRRWSRNCLCVSAAGGDRDSVAGPDAIRVK